LFDAHVLRRLVTGSPLPRRGGAAVSRGSGLRLSGALSLGSGAGQAARQAAVLFALSGVSAFAALPGDPDHTGRLALIGVADLATALVAWVLPWDRWGRPILTALLAVPAFAVLGVSTWAFGGFAAGTGPFFVLIFAWLGLHYRPWVIVANAVPATVAYLVPLIVVGSPQRVLSSAVVLIPVAVGIGLVIAGRVRELCEERLRAEQAEGWRAALVATLAHDIRSPLTTVQTTLMLLDETPDLPADRHKSLIAAALRQTRRLARLAAGLLDLERVQQGKLRLDRRWVSVAEVAEGAAGLAAADAEVAVHVDPALRVYADPDRLEQVLINLVANAVRHGEPPVVVTAERGEGTVRIAVRDHGPGVPERRRAALFERLVGDSDHPDSVGLGMWIVRLLVEAHGGAVVYEPALPGARFTVSLPARDEPVGGSS
jgi:signal transduction histidine kinase